MQEMTEMFAFGIASLSLCVCSVLRESPWTLGTLRAEVGAAACCSNPAIHCTTDAFSDL